MNKSETVKYCMISYVESEKTTLMKNAENRSLVARGRRRRVGRMGEGGQKVQTSGYKTHMFWACNVSMVTTVNNTVYLKVAEKVDLTSSHYKEKNLFLCKVMDVN